MTDQPSHPETDDSGVGPDERPPSGRPSLMRVLGFVVVGVMILTVVVLHLTGVIGPGAHGG